MTKILDGKKISNDIKDELKVKVEKLKQEHDVTPGLALLIVGENPASQVYVRSKIKACEYVGIKSIHKELPDTATEEEVLQIIQEWNMAPDVHGILVQLPLPKQIDENKVILTINPDKDVDGFHPVNLGKLLQGLPAFAPCTPAGIMEIFKRYNIDLKAKHAVVLGRSNIVGKPISFMMMQKSEYANAIVTICHSAEKDFSKYTKKADVVVAAVGIPNMVKAEHIKEGAVIIDVGINRIDAPDTEKGYIIVGDVDYENVFDKVSAITPVPGGVGRMTIAMLLENTYLSAKNNIA